MEKWLLVEWADSSRTVVPTKSVVNRKRVNFRTGSSVLIDEDGERKLATYLARSDDRSLMQQLVSSRPKRTSSPLSMLSPLSPLEDTDDYSASETSWAPTDEEESESEAENIRPQNKIIIARPWRGSILNGERPVLQPTNQGNPRGIPTGNPRGIPTGNPTSNPTQAPRSQSRNSTNCMPDSNSTPQPDGGKVDNAVIEDIFKTIFQLVNEVTNDDEVTSSNPQKTVEQVFDIVPGSDGEDTVIIAPKSREEPEDGGYGDDVSDRSDDNILISNRYDNIQNQNKQFNLQGDVEWIPIGTGNTLIHRDKYKKVNWTTYTTATRSLLLALFPRRTLATCSLTGKKSPAFKDRPAKMCLDPKKISDIIYEVMGRFRVKENLVRSIITTKCADESKMFRTRVKKKQKTRTKKSSID